MVKYAQGITERGDFMEFRDRVCMVTGGAKGIGRCITRSFGKEGAKVVFLDVDREAGEENLKYLIDNGCEATFIQGDAGVKEDLDKFIDETLKQYGRIDFLINNACFGLGGISSKCSYEDFDRVLSVGLKAPYYLSMKTSQELEKSRGAIVNIASTRAFMSEPDSESYACAKGGIIALTHASAVSLGPKVRVNSISPGWIETRNSIDYSIEDEAQHPVGRVGKVEDIANAVLYLCSEKSGFITGQNIIIDGGMSVRMIYHNESGWKYTK